MQRITTYIILAAVFLSGMLMIYRSSFQTREWNKIKAKVTNRQIEPVYEHKRKTYYAVTFSLAGVDYKPGIHIGTKNEHSLIPDIDTGVVYTFLMNPDFKTVKQLNLGIHEIRLQGHTIYRESQRSTLRNGIVLILIATVACALFWKYNNRIKAPRPNM